MKKPLLILCTVILLPLAGCDLIKDDVKIATSNEESLSEEEKGEKKNSTEGFSYINQNEWEFVSGNMQSPIDIKIGTSIENNGYSIQSIL